MKINYYVEGKILIWSGYPLVAAINQAIQGAVFSRFPVWQARAAGHCFCVLAIAGCVFGGACLSSIVSAPEGTNKACNKGKRNERNDLVIIRSWVWKKQHIARIAAKNRRRDELWSSVLLQTLGKLNSLQGTELSVVVVIVLGSFWILTLDSRCWLIEINEVKCYEVLIFIQLWYVEQ